MPVNVTVRDIVNFPGGTPKTITLDIAQIIPTTGSPEGDEIWVSSATTTATASGAGAIQNIFKNQMKRGFIRGVPPASTLIDIPATPPARLKIAIDEAIANGVDIELTPGTSLLSADVAQDLENKIRAQAEIGGGGSKLGNLSYLNAQVRFNNGVFSIESGTVTGRFTGPGRSSVTLDAPDLGTDIRQSLGLHLTVSSEELATRQLAEASLVSDYTTGDLLEVSSTSGFAEGDPIQIRDSNNDQIVLVSGVGISGDLQSSQIRFVTTSGASSDLNYQFNTGSVVRKLHPIDNADPVSAVQTMDQLYRFQIDSIVNQIDFSS